MEEQERATDEPALVSSLHAPEPVAPGPGEATEPLTEQAHADNAAADEQQAPVLQASASASDGGGSTLAVAPAAAAAAEDDSSSQVLPAAAAAAAAAPATAAAAARPPSAKPADAAEPVDGGCHEAVGTAAASTAAAACSSSSPRSSKAAVIKETAEERLTTPTAMRMLKSLQATQGDRGDWHIASGVTMRSKKLAADEMSAMVNRLCTAKPADALPPKPHAVKLVYEGTKEVLVPVKESTKAENIAYMSALYDRCKVTRAKTQQALEDKYLQPLFRPPVHHKPPPPTAKPPAKASTT